MVNITFETRTSLNGRPTHKAIIVDGVAIGYAHRATARGGWAVCTLAKGCVKDNVLTADLKIIVRQIINGKG